uniref:TIL domain-containing protein n=1 Tax=Romanomermis culicivorax TaxID=13658 RepID=A0A915JFN7_ROMCU
MKFSITEFFKEGASECPAGQILNPCGKGCQTTCAEVIANQVRPFCPQDCSRPACVCLERNHAMNQNGQCVTYDKC